MAERPHPVRKRTGLTELNALLLPLALLGPVLLAVTVQAAIIATSPTEVELEELAPLRVPEMLAFERARRVAANATASVLDRSRASFDATTLTQHIEAVARHMAVSDRPAAPPIDDALRPGESLNQLARRWRLRTEDLLELNPDLDPEGLQPGQPIRVWEYSPDGYSRSIGPSNRGRLERAEPMPDGAGWIVRSHASAWGARQTVDGLVDAMRVTMAEHPRGQELMVADLSRLGGGRFPPHRSHQNGRDVDVTYFRRTQAPPTFGQIRARELDLPRTWTFIRRLVTAHNVHYIFMSLPLQRALYDYASRQGEHPAFLAEVFALHSTNARAIIRFAPGHNDHMHIRFGCAPSDVRCGP